MGTLDFAQQGVGSVVPSRGMAAENAGSTLRSNEVGNAQERCRATFARGEREDFQERARLRPRCGSDGDTSSTSGARVQLGGDKERVARGQAKKEWHVSPARPCVCGGVLGSAWVGYIRGLDRHVGDDKEPEPEPEAGPEASQRQRQRQVTRPEGR